MNRAFGLEGGHTETGCRQSDAQRPAGLWGCPYPLAGRSGAGQSVQMGGRSSAISRSLFLRTLSRVPSGNASTA